jgi:hypothetical protein
MVSRFVTSLRQKIDEMKGMEEFDGPHLDIGMK